MPTTPPELPELHAAAHRLPFDLGGPFVRLGNNAIFTPGPHHGLTSSDEGSTWEKRPYFEYGENEQEYKVSRERAIVRTSQGTLLASFMNLNERRWLWRNELKDALPGTRLPHYVMRSLDDGQAWEKPIMLHQDWTGDVRDMIVTRSGRIVVTSMRLLHGPGRHSVLTYTSDDEGQTWTNSNVIDLGDCGHHGGATESTVVELNDGRLLLLIRTNLMQFWQATSEDQGSSWRSLGPSGIAASSAPGLLTRLASGRLMLAWNRPYPEGKDSYPMRGGDGLWSAMPVSNHRGEMSIAFSDDDAATWSSPVVLARTPDGNIAYPRVFEVEPGRIWLTTMFGGLRTVFHEQDLLNA
jgi:sialidase-1